MQISYRGTESNLMFKDMHDEIGKHALPGMLKDQEDIVHTLELASRGSFALL